jgi:ATP synthase protein I
MPSDPSSNRNDDLTPAEKQAKGFSQQFATAMELPFVIVGTIMMGGLLGFLLDRWLHTKPHLMLLFGALGFFAGVRDVLRRLPNK